MNYINKILLVSILVLISCNKLDEYKYSKETALSINQSDKVFVDSFGGLAPYKHTGGIQSSLNK